MQEWIGYGPSASSQMGRLRWTEEHSLDEWLIGLESGQPRLAERVELDDQMLAQDYLIFGLRMNQGVDLSAWKERFPDALPSGWESLRERLVGEGLAVQSSNWIRLTDAGRLVADRIGEEILGLD